MGHIRRARLQLTASLLLPFVLSASALADQYRWRDISRVVAISDPHGAYDAFTQTLENAGIINEQLSWSGGETHLVITGDLLDRGAESRVIMDLVMRLESEALQSGGMVHLTLGNHEVMNLVGDLRYVSREEFAAFEAEESATEREHWFQKYRVLQALQMESVPDDAVLRAEFDKTRPPGFFAHRQAFASEGKYGRWLLDKPLMVVINDTAFVHGGLPPMVAEMGLNGLNDELRSQVSDYVRQFNVLTRDGLIDPSVSFYNHVKAAEALSGDAQGSPQVLVAVQTLIELNNASVHDRAGPLWYRGSVGCSELTESDVITMSLAAVGASRVVIGHTPTVTRQVLERLDGRVIEIDTGMLRSSYGGSGSALIMEGDELSVIQQGSAESGKPVLHPRRVGERAEELSAEVLEQLLANADIVSSRENQSGQKIVELSREKGPLSALFVESSRTKGVNTALAAYRLDRLLGLDMVPVAVAREVNGERGTLQFLPQNSRDETYRSASRQGAGAWCPLPRQWNSMYIFDVLVYNELRAPETMAYSPENWQLLLMGHGRTFSTKRNRPQHLVRVPLRITSGWIEALSSLTDERLEENLGDVLDKRRLTALGKRRDMLLAEAGR